METPFLAGLADAVIEQMGEAYPELVQHRREIAEVLGAEEEQFAKTLERGMKLFDEAAAKGDITGKDAFTLQATYGFPIELTQELARERGLGVNDEEFTRLMEAQRERSRSAAGFDVRVIGDRPTEFVGYEKTDVLTAISALEEREDGLFDAKLFESPFYAEGDRVKAVVPWNARYPTMANHTATHVLHECLREVLGEHVKQAGSAVRPDKLRFDFTHPQALTPEQRERVEHEVNRVVFENHPVRAFVTPIEEARNLGAMMLFGEKYGEEVRVVEVDGYSRELCGGTHVRSTAEIGPFVVLSEGSVGSGARRIEAVTAGEAFALLHERAREADELRFELAEARKQAKRETAPAAGAEFEIRDRQGNVVFVEAKAVKGGPLRDLSDRVRKQERADGVIVASVDDGRVYLVVNFDESLRERGLDAVEVVRQLGPLIGGGGGGRPTLAEAGGRNPKGVAEAFEAGKRAIAAALG